MGGGWTRGRPAWEPQNGAEPERSSGSGRDGGGCPGLCGRGARGGGGGGERAGGGGEGCRGRGRRGEVLPASRPGRIPPTRIPQARHCRLVPGGPVLSGPIAMLRPFPPLKATGRAGNPLPGPTEGSKGVSDLQSPSLPPPRVAPSAHPTRLCWLWEGGDVRTFCTRSDSLLGKEEKSVNFRLCV